MRQFVLIVIGIGLINAASRVGLGQVVYDSSGFEANRFSSAFINPAEPSITGDLSGQDTGVNPWSYFGPMPATSATGTAQVVTNTNQLSSGYGPVGTQSLRVLTGTANDAWGPVLDYDATGKTVAIKWTMANDFFANGGVAIFQETYIGVNVFGSTASGGSRTLLAGLGLNAQGTQILYYDASSTPVLTPAGPNYIGVSPASFEIDLNYSSHTFQSLVDSNVVAAGSFLADSNSLTGVDISTWVPQSQIVFPRGGAYIDDLVVGVVPEPGLAALPLLALTAFCRRPRRTA